jgi:hypothetical protein
MSEVERKLRLVESAAASAVLNGCDPAEIRRHVEIGITEALELNRRRPSTQASAHATSSGPRHAAEPSKTPAIDAFAESVFGRR